LARLVIKNHLAIVLDREKTPPPNEAYDEPRHLHKVSWLLMRWALAREHAAHRQVRRYRQPRIQRGDNLLAIGGRSHRLNDQNLATIPPQACHS
jgi:hypothetical protein